jgi:hypothetical protein
MSGGSAGDAMGAPSLRRRLSRWLRRRLDRLRYRAACRRLTTLEGAFRGRRAFLVANGPSLKAMRLQPLGGEFVCLVNMGLRGAGHGIPRVDMHVLLDNNRYRRFADEVERIAEQHAVRYRFMNWGARRIWRRHARGAAEPYYILGSDRRLAVDGFADDLRAGVSGSGATVLIGASQILFFMGFSEVYVIGCDLDYGSPSGAYFYAMDALDLVHEADPNVVARRAEMQDANREFAIVRAHFEAHGRVIRNAGLGGRLETLERIAFDRLFPGAP